MKKKKTRASVPYKTPPDVVLYRIAVMGSGIPSDVIDWAQIGKNAVHLAKEALGKQCLECGHIKPFHPPSPANTAITIPEDQ